MVNISFSKNWNQKLCCDVFTTIRYKSPCKKGDIVSVSTKTESHVVNSFAEVLNVESYLLKDIPECVFAFDMGMSKELATKEIKKIYFQYNIHEIKFDIIVMRHHYPKK